MRLGWRMVAASLRVRRARASLAFAALVVGATLTAALLTLSFDIRAKMSRELRAYGANLLVVGNVARESDVDAVGRLDGVSCWVPALVGVVPVKSQPLALVGVDVARLRKLSPYLSVDGSWDGALVGTRLARSLGVQSGSMLTVGSQSVRVSGIVESGGDEDGQMFVPLAVAQKALGKPREINTIQVQVSGGLSAVEAVARQVESLLPGTQGRPLRQLAATQGVFLDRITRITWVLTSLILVVCGICVMTTMFTQVTERRKEIGLMKALGAEDAQVARLFLSEGAALGLLAGLLGWPAGVLLARGLGQALFDTRVAPRLESFPVVVGLALLLAAVAQVPPLRRALSIEPATTLKGE